MSYEVQEVNEYTRRAQVVVPVEDYKTEFNRALRTLSKRVKISGFRKGKIPLSVMKKQYGPSVRQDVIEELLRTHIDKLLSEQDDVLFLERPNVETLPSNTQSLKFNVEFEISPKLDPVGYMGVDVGRPTPSVGDEELEAEIEKLRQQHAVLEPVEIRDEIKAGDIVTLDFKAVAQEPEELQQLKGEDVQIEVGEGTALPGIEDALVGAKFATKVKANVTLDANFPVESLQGEEVELELNIKSVKTRVLPTVDDDFAADTGLGETLLDLRSKLRERLEQAQQNQAREIAADNLIDVLLEKHPFELPEKFFQQQLQNYATNRLQSFAQQGIDPGQFGITPDSIAEGAKDGLFRQIKSEFLIMAIARIEEIQVTEADLKALWAKQAPEMGVDAEMWGRYVSSDQDRLNQSASTARVEKTIDALLEKANIKEIEWPVEAEEE